MIRSSCQDHGGGYSAFCDVLSEVRAELGQTEDARCLAEAFGLDLRPAEIRLLSGFSTLQWGGQLSVSVLESFEKAGLARETLASMRRLGCSYIYVGLESMAGDVMSHVHKAGRTVTLARGCREQGMCFKCSGTPT